MIPAMVTVELQFPYVAAALPSDHGYALYSAISRLIPEVHAADWIAIATIPGKVTGRGFIIPDPGGALRLRLPEEKGAVVRELAGKTLDLNGCALGLGAPRQTTLAPSARLDARIVTIRGFTEPAPLLEAVRRKLDDLGIFAETQCGARRVVRIAGRTVVGFAVSLRSLDAKASLNLQEVGIGGRRRFGCGILLPAGDEWSGDATCRNEVNTVA